jgi:hypothetical protein
LQLLSPYLRWIFVVSSLAPEHVINLITLVPDQATGRSAFLDRTPPLELGLMHRVPSICFMLPSIFNLLTVFFMMLRLVNEVFNTHLRLRNMCHLLHGHHIFCVPFSEKLDSLPDYLDSWRTMLGYQNDTLEWVHTDRNDSHYCSGMMLHGL